MLLGDAFAHVTFGRVFGVIRRPWSGVFSLAAVVVGLVYARAMTAAIVIGFFGALTLVAAAYMLWYSGFVQRNRSLGVLCPQCTSRMWQFCCARCREPVPALALFLRGAFLAACPH